MFKDIFLLRTRPIDLQGWQSIHYAIVPINCALCAIVMTALFFLKGACYPQVLARIPDRPMLALFEHSPLVLYFLVMLGLYLLLFLVGWWLSQSSFDSVVKRLILRSAPLLTVFLIALWYTDVPYSGSFICHSFHDRGVRSYHIVPPVVVYAGISMAIGLWNARRVGAPTPASPDVGSA